MLKQLALSLFSAILAIAGYRYVQADPAPEKAKFAPDLAPQTDETAQRLRRLELAFVLQHSPKPVTEPQPTESPVTEVVAEQTDAMEALSRTYDSETRDENWAAHFERAVMESIATHAPNAQVKSLTCRAASCRLVIDHAMNDDWQTFLQGAKEVVFRDAISAGGTVTTDAFIVRSL